MAIASAAIFKSESTWKPGCKSSRVTWAINTARLAYLVNHGHEARAKRCGMGKDANIPLSKTESRPLDIDRHMDVATMLEMAKSIIGERHYNIIADSTKYTRREAAKRNGIGLSRMSEIEITARDKARRAIKSILAKNKCESLSDLV